VIVEGAKAQRDTCKKQYPVKTAEYAKCLGRWIEALRYWVQVAKPALNGALITAVTGLQIAERAKKKPAGVWELIKMGLCAVMKIPFQFKALLGTRLIQIEAVTKPLSGVLRCRD